MYYDTVLYRGDLTPINWFSFEKTNKAGLVGQGIYLTTSKDVAESYRPKGGEFEKFPVSLYNGSAANKDDARFKAFLAYLRFVGCEALSKVVANKTRPFTKEEMKLHKAHCSAFKDLVDRKRLVTIERGSYPNELCPTGMKLFVVSMKHEYSVGFVSAFRFSAGELTRDVFKLNRVIDPEIWGLLHDHQIPVGFVCSSREEYIQTNLKYGTLEPWMAGVQASAPKLRQILSEYGYKGFEYSGGRFIGTLGNHRAFCFWDEAYINRRRTELLSRAA